MRLWTIGMVLLVSASAARGQARLDFDWSLPIHRNPHGEIWASGPSYKVRFDDTVTFVPILGADEPEPISWSWRTVSARLDGRVLLDGEPETAWSDARFERRHSSGLVEIWELRADGVEQMFVLERAPDGPTGADLVVTGLVDGLRGAAAPDFDVRSLTFLDGRGRETVTYGEAAAFDAGADRVPVESRLVDGRVELRVDGTWLARARYPVVVDPVVANARYPGSEPGVMDLFAATESANKDQLGDELLMTITRAASSSDWDLTAVSVDVHTMTVVSTVMTDLGTTWSTHYAQCGIGTATSSTGTNYWMVAAQRDPARSGASRIWIYSQAFGAPTNGGTWYPVPGTPSASQRFPSMSGAHRVNHAPPIDVHLEAVVVYQEDAAIPARNTSNSSVWAVGFNPFLGRMTAPAAVAGAPGEDHEWPSITRTAAKPVVVWQSRGSQRNATWDVQMAQLAASDPLPVSVAWRTVVAAGPEDEVRPIVGYAHYRLLVAFTRKDPGTSIPTPDGAGHAIDAQVFDVPIAAGPPTPTWRRPVAAAIFQPRVSTGGGVRGIGADWTTGSHWAIAFTRDGTLTNGNRDAEIVRVGYSAGIVEHAVLQQGTSSRDAFSPSVSFHDATRDFPVVWASTSRGATGSYYARGARLAYPAATTSTYNAGCQGALVGYNREEQNGPPYAGSEFYELRLSGGLADALSVLVLGLDNSLTLPFSQRCAVYVGAAPLVYGVGTSDQFGRYSFEVPLPDYPLLQGDLYWQALQVHPTANTVTTSDGAVTRIR